MLRSSTFLGADFALSGRPDWFWFRNTGEEWRIGVELIDFRNPEGEIRLEFRVSPERLRDFLADLRHVVYGGARL